MKAHSIYCILSAVAILGTSYNVFAQPDSIINNQRVNIYQDYVPEVKIPTKPALTPSEVNITDDHNPDLQYNVPQQTIRYSYGSVGIKPLALKPLERETNYQNYAAIGLGNLTTFMLDAGLTYYMKGAYDAYLHGYHFSQKKGDIHDRLSSFTQVSGGGKYYLNKYVINADASVSRRAQTAYGYDHDAFVLDKKDIKHNLFNINFKAGIDNIALPVKSLTFQPDVELNVLNGYNDASELILKINAPFSYSIDENIQVGVAAKSEMDFYNHSFFNTDSSMKMNAYLMLVPSIKYSFDKFMAYAALKPTFLTNDNVRILPDIQIRYVVGEPSKVSLSAGIKGDVEMYSFKNLSDKNPFVFNPVNANAIHHQFFGGVEYSMLSNLKLELTGIYHRFSKYATYQNNYQIDPTGRYFKINYLDNVNLFELNAGAHILIANKFDLGAVLALYNFKNNVGVAFHEPNVHLKSYMKVKPMKHLMVGAQLDVLTGIKYLDENGMRNSMSNIFNLSASAQYDIKERFAVFVNLDNILNSKYQRWNQYNVYGFNIFAGFKYKF